MAEIPIERKEGRNWLPLILGLLALLLLGFCFLRNRGNTTAAATADTTAVAAGAGAAAGAAGAGVAGTPNVNAGAVPADSAPATSPGGGPGAVNNVTAGGANQLIDQYVQFVQTRDTTQETEGNHIYTAEGTSRLAAALEGIAGGNPNVGAYADSMRRSIQRMRTAGPNDTHADDAKAAFSAAVTAMEQIDRARGRTRDAAPMRAIYNQLNARQPLLPQLPTVDRFFKAAADALQQMRSA